MSSFDDDLDARIALLLREDGAADVLANPAPTTFVQAETAAAEYDSYFASDRLQFIASAPGETEESPADPEDASISWHIAVWWEDAPAPLGFIHLEGARRSFEANEDWAAIDLFDEIEPVEASAFILLLREELLSGIAEMLTTDLSDEDEAD